MIITRRKNNGEDEITIPEEVHNVKYPNPRILLIDIDKEIIDSLTEKGFNVTNGSFGTSIKVPNIEKYQNHYCLANPLFPPNVHEFEIIIVDLEDKGNFKDYDKRDHKKNFTTGSKSTYILSSFPETLYNPKPLGASFIRSDIQEICENGGLIIIFGAGNYSVNYQFIHLTPTGVEAGDSKIYRIYDFLPINIISENKYGKIIKIDNPSHDLQRFFRKYYENPKFNVWYNIIFKFRADEKVIPILRNSTNEIIGFIEIYKKGIILILPQIENKKDFFEELFLNELPAFYPRLFPYQTQFRWLDDDNYFLPNEDKLNEKKLLIISEYQQKITEINHEIEANKIKFQCLHGLLIKSSQELVNDVGKFLKWLGFENVKFMDYEEDQKQKEEDIQVEVTQGLLVIEVKGIIGTSKDEECSQISKIKFRRAEERRDFDVFGLYIVNHQKHLPPLERENPPFKPTQIEDAIREKRGLLSTWQLFNLYYSIQSGAILKEEARNSLLNCGLITFYPSNVKELGKPKNVLKDGQVFLIDSLVPISKSNKIIIKRNERFLLASIIEMQVHDKPVEMIEKGEVGIKIDLLISKSDVLFLKE